MPFHLKVIAGPDQNLTLPLPASGSVIIGRGNDEPTDLTDPSVSRMHFSLTMGGGYVLLQELGSKTGTLVNNQRVDSEKVLKPGDLIVIGASYLQLVETKPAEPAGAAPPRAAATPRPRPRRPARHQLAAPPRRPRRTS
jgi:pSer/pThr/pTyr-binding forkhead associated (FHA) protein